MGVMDCGIIYLKTSKYEKSEKALILQSSYDSQFEPHLSSPVDDSVVFSTLYNGVLKCT
jgi:hypothetical protein